MSVYDSNISQFDEVDPKAFNQLLAAPVEPYKQPAEPHNPEPRSTIGEIWSQLKAGTFSDLPKRAGRAMQYASSPGNSMYEAGKSLVEDANAIATLPEMQLSSASDSTITGALAKGARMIPASIAPAVGAGLVLSGVGAPAGAALIGGSALQAIPAGMAQAQETYEKGLAKHGITPEQAAAMPNDPRVLEATKAGRITGGIEFGGELAGSVIAGRFLGIGGGMAKSAIGRMLNKGEQSAAQTVLKSFTSPGTVGKFAGNALGTAAGETATEMGQNYGEAATEKHYGYDNQDPWDSAKEAIAPTLGMTALLLPFGIPAHASNAVKMNAITRILEDPAIAPEARSQAAEIVYNNLAKSSPDAAANFAAHSFDAIHGDQETGSTPYSLTLDDSVLQPLTPRALQEQQQAKPTGPLSRAASAGGQATTQPGIDPGATNLLRENDPSVTTDSQPAQPAYIDAAIQQHTDNLTVAAPVISKGNPADSAAFNAPIQAPTIPVNSLHGTLQRFINMGQEKTSQSGQAAQTWNAPSKLHLDRTVSTFLQPAVKQGLVSRDNEGTYHVNTDQGALRITPPSEATGNYLVEYHSAPVIQPAAINTPDEQFTSQHGLATFEMRPSQGSTPEDSGTSHPPVEQPIPIISHQAIESAFPGQTITPNAEGYTVTLKNGATVKITTAGDINFNVKAAETAYGRKTKPDEKPVAAFQQLDHGAVITLTEQGADQIHHETFHTAMHMALNEKQRDMIIKKFGTEEAAAQEYQRLRDSKAFTQPRRHHMFLQSIYDFFQKIRTMFNQTHGIMVDVASGKVWENPTMHPQAQGVNSPPREQQGTSSESPKYSLQDTLSRLTSGNNSSNYNDTIQPPQGTDNNARSAVPEIEKRWQAAHGLSGGPTLEERMKSFIQNLLSETEHYPNLDTSSFSGKRTADILRRFESSDVAAKAKTVEYLHSLTTGFGPKKMDLFTRKVVLDDLMTEASKGRPLPFGYTPETVKADHLRISKLVESNPDVNAAIERRTQVNKTLVMELVDNDLLPVESVLTPEGLEHYKKTEKYGPDDINTGYFRHQVLEHANARKWAGISTAGEVRNKRRGWQKQREGSTLDINTNFLEAEFEVYSQSMKELATKKALDEVLNLNDVTAELKDQAKRNNIEDWNSLIPEGYTAWQPKRGSVFYRGQSLPESIITRFADENPAFKDMMDKFRAVTIMGGKKETVIIPEGLAKTLDNLRTNREDATLDTINKKLVGGWKIWTLLSPRRALKYNLNNMSGDLDIAFAADPGILKQFKTAWKNALERRAGRAMSQDERDMLDRAVIDAGISINEIPDISKLPGFQNLKEPLRNVKLLETLQSGNLSKLMPTNLVAKYFDTVSGLTQLREGLLREAAYLRAKELLEKGKTIYWASKPDEIDALPDIKDKAAKLSRELIGDYGNISAHGEKIRTSLIPFWSWMEINTPRYYRLFKNAATQKESGSFAARMAGVGARKTAGAALNIAEKVALTHLLFAAVNAFNHLMHPDEEKKLSAASRGQLHLILGTTSDDKILSVRFSGAFSDALSWFGMGDYTESIKSLTGGQMDAQDMLKKMFLATPNKLANSASPFIKLAGELITGKSIYPDISKPMPIRDKSEHVARFFALDEEYKALAGKPSKGYLDSLKNLLVYESDPGEIAYHNTRQQLYRFLEKRGIESPSAEPNERSKALYYFKPAVSG